MRKNTKLWIRAFAFATPVAIVLATIAVGLGYWLPRQLWFADFILQF